MGGALALRRVIAPQALRAIIPSLGNILVWMLLATPLTATIGTPDLMYQALIVQNRFYDFSVFALLTLIYVSVALVLGAGTLAVERRLRLP